MYSANYVFSPMIEGELTSIVTTALPLPLFCAGSARMFQPPRDDTRDRTKITDKDSPSNVGYADVIENKSTDLLITKAEQIKATQNLVDKKILGSLVLIGDGGKSNPFRNKSRSKKRKKLEREIAKLGDEVLAQIPAEKLSQLLDSEMEASDTAVLSDSLREKLKSLLQSAVAAEQTVDDDESQREIAAPNTQPGSTTSNALNNNKITPPAGNTNQSQPHTYQSQPHSVVGSAQS
jgi:hypothetical protein